MTEDEVDVGPFVTEQTRAEQGRRLRNPRVRALLDAGAALVEESLGGGIDDPFRFPTLPAVCSTAALVMVVPGRRSQGRWPSPVPRIDSRKMWIAIAFWLPSGCGSAVTPM